MTPLRANPALLLCLASVLLTGCPGKKPVAAAPPPAPAPVASPEPTPQPPGTQAQNQESQPATQGTPPPDVSQEEPAEKAEKAKPKNGKARTAARKPAAPAQSTAKTTETARNNSPRIIVKPDGTEAAPASGTISPGPAQADSTRNQATTEQLLQGAETTLTNLKRQLSKEEEAIVTQIKDFAKQSRQATQENDSARAHNLALKAYLLSDDLAKRR